MWLMEWSIEDLKKQLKEERAYFRSLIRAKEPNIHVMESVQKMIREIKETLQCKGITNIKSSKYE